MDKATVIVGDFNTFLSVINKQTKYSEDTDDEWGWSKVRYR